jgi:DNA-directed RNA polymerase subunit omega
VDASILNSRSTPVREIPEADLDATAAMMGAIIAEIEPEAADEPLNDDE